MEKQYKKACEILESNETIMKTTKKIIFYGNSLGGLIARAVIQNCEIGKKVNTKVQK